MSAREVAVTADATAENPHWQVRMRAGARALAADEPQPEGTDTAPSPFELWLAGLGSCTAITLQMYAERKGWPLESVGVDVSCRVGGEPGPVQRTVRLVGPLSDDQRARLADIAERTPVTTVVKAGVEIVTTLG
jgi:putative redox protein